MVGVQLQGRAAPVIKALQERGVLALPAGKNAVRFLPALNMPEGDFDRLSDALCVVLSVEGYANAS